jgi:hypothetical protein
VELGVNQNGYRWTVENETSQGKGDVAKLWREGQRTAIAGREGFSTREGAVTWATEYRGQSIAPSVLAGFGFMFGVIVVAGLVSLVTGGGQTRTVVRINRLPRGDARARPNPRQHPRASPPFVR